MWKPGFAAMLGPASLWKIVCSIVSNGATSQTSITLDSLNLCATDIVVETSGSPSLLESRIIDAVAAGQQPGAQISVERGPASDGSVGFGELSDFTVRLRTLLAKSSALGPQHVQGPDSSPGLGLNTGELQGRVTALQSSFSAAVAQLNTAQQNLGNASSPGDLQTAVAAIRAALVALADHGLPSAYPAASGSDVQAAANQLGSLASSVLGVATPLSAKTAPPPPAADATPSDVASWFSETAAFVQAIIGTVVPLTATYLLPASSAFAASFAAGAAPSGSDGPGVMAWLRRIARVRTNALAIHDSLLAGEAILGSSPPITVAQLPVTAGEAWIALPYADGVPDSQGAPVHCGFDSRAY